MVSSRNTGFVIKKIAKPTYVHRGQLKQPINRHWRLAN